MIIKSIPVKRSRPIQSVLQYMFREHTPDNFIHLHNIEGCNVSELTRQFALNDENRLHVRKNNNLLIHFVISFSSKDSREITKDVLRDFTKRFIEINNDSALYLAIEHKADNPHVHIAMSGVDVTGMSTRITKEKYRSLRAQLNALQQEKYKSIQFSFVDYEKSSHKTISEKEFQLKRRSGKQSDRERTEELVMQAYQQAQSEPDFYNRIEAQGLQVYHRNGKPYGVVGKRKARFSKLGVDISQLQHREELMKQFKLLREHPNHRKMKEHEQDRFTR